MTRTSFKTWENRYLLKMYELAAETTMEMVDLNEVERLIGIPQNEKKPVWKSLLDQGLIYGTLGKRAMVTTNGRGQLDYIMENTYADEELTTLRKIAELGEGKPMGWVELGLLQKELPNLSFPIDTLVNELERKGYVGGADEAVGVLPKGWEFLQNKSNAFSPIQQFNIGTIHNAGQMAFGNNNQLVSQTKVDFNSAVNALSRMIESSTLSDDDKETATDALVALEKLSARDDTEQRRELAKLRIQTIDVIFKGAEVAAKAGPYIATLYSYFQTL